MAFKSMSYKSLLPQPHCQGNSNGSWVLAFICLGMASCHSLRRGTTLNANIYDKCIYV